MVPVTSHALAQISSHVSHTIITTVFLVMVSLEVLTTKVENQFMANLWPHLIQGISYSSDLTLSRNEIQALRILKYHSGSLFQKRNSNSV